MKVRKATSADATFLWDVTNSAREWFFSTEAISWDDHMRWLAEVLVDPNRCLLVGVDDAGVRIGSVRFDRSVDQVHVSIALAPESRGQGLGKRLLDSGIAFYGEAVYVAEVRQRNQASRALFSRWMLMEDGDPCRFILDTRPGPNDCT